MGGWLLDVTYAARSLRKKLGFTTAVVVTLGLGIGVNAAVFTVVDSVLLRPLPFAEPERLVRVWVREHESGEAFLDAKLTELEVLRASGSFEEVAALSPAPRDLADRYTTPETVTVARVAGDLFAVLGVRAALGRTPGGGDLQDERVVAIDHRLWQSRYGGAGDIVGSTILLRGEAHEIVGVLPPWFDYPEQASLWRPLFATESEDDDRELQVIARLATGVTVEEANARLSALGGDAPVTAWVEPLRATLVRGFRDPLLLIWGAVGAVLVIACANVASLTFAQNAQREREIAVRLAIGSGRRRLIRQLVTESMVLAAVGAVAGLIVGGWVLDLVLAFAPADAPRLEEIRLDERVGWIVFGASLVAGFLFGLFPALRASRPRWLPVLTVGRGVGGAPTSSVRRALVMGQTATSTLLVALAALLSSSFDEQHRTTRGFTTEDVVILPVRPPAGFDTGAAAVEFFERLSDRLAQLDVRVGMASTSPMEPRGLRVRVHVSGRDVDEEAGDVYVKAVSPG